MSSTRAATYRGEPSCFAGLGIVSRERLGAEEVLAVRAVDQFLAVEEDEVDPPGALQVVQVMGDLHQQGHARGAVVGAQEREAAA